MEVAYGPLVAELTRRLQEAHVDLPAPPPESTAGIPQASYKRALLQAAVDRFGLSFVESLGRRLATYAGHPFVSALSSADSPGRLVQRWQRLEVLAHSENRVSTPAVDDRQVRFVRSRRSGGAPTLAEDALIAGVLAGLLESIGAESVCARVDPGIDDAATGRVWVLAWTGWGAPRRPSAVEPWGVSSHFAQAVFALLLEDTGLGMTEVARRLHVSERSLQRRLGEAGTTFRSLSRTARVALAGTSLARAGAALPSLTSVALACGFADSAHFSREFRSLVGVPPRRFVRAVRE